MDMLFPPFPLFHSRLALGVFLVIAQASTASAQITSPATNSAPTPTPAPPPPGIIFQHDVVFGKGGERDLHAEIAYPKDATGLLPAIIYVHGGGWSGGDQKHTPVLQIAQAGYFGASIEYRLSKEAKWPAQIEDCQLAVRWLRSHAADYHIDPNRIGAWGDSAGGHLVACLATMADTTEYTSVGDYPGVSSGVQAVCDYYGPTDFTDAASNPAKTVGQHVLLFGSTYDQKAALWKSGSPLFDVKAGDPPMLLIHGDADTTVPLAQSTALDAALTQAGVPHQFVIVKNADHGFRPVSPGMAIDPSRADIQKMTFSFFDKYLKGP